MASGNLIPTSTDTSDDSDLGPDRTGTDDSVATDDSSFELPGTLQNLVKNPKGWIIATLTGISLGTAADKLAEGKSAVSIILDDWLFETFLLPAAVSIYDAGISIINSILIIIFGSEQWAGLADIPAILVGPLVTLITLLWDIPTDFIWSINTSIADAVVPLGMPAPAILAFLFIMELGGVYLLARWAISTALGALLLSGAARGFGRFAGVVKRGIGLLVG